MKKLAFIVGRFQPFHKGHQNLIDSALECDRVLIFLGSSQESRTYKNPLTYDERKNIILSNYSGENIDFVPLIDFESDEEWLNEIEKKLNHYADEYSLISVFCNKDQSTTVSNELFKNLNVTLMEVELSSNINATDVRKKIFLEKTDLSCLDELHENTKNILMDYLQSISL